MGDSALHLPITDAKSSVDDVSDTLKTATSHDLVFAVVGHAGAGATWVADRLEDGLKLSSYEPVRLKMSDRIREAVCLIDATKWKDLTDDKYSRIKRTMLLQDAGNWLRENCGATFTAALAIKWMHDERRQRNDTGKKIAFIIDSLKNPLEVDALRKVYDRSFYVISVVCGPEVRKTRLRTKYKAGKEHVPALMTRDEAQDAGTGQHVRKTLQAGDFFVNNEPSTPTNAPDPLDQALTRFLQIVLASEVVRPMRDERGMYAAWTAGMRSACISRQVGAAILDKAGLLIASGTNDVPRFGGGLYEETDEKDAIDCRCFKYPNDAEGESSGFCRNDKVKKKILVEAIQKLRDLDIIKKGTDDAAIESALRDTPLDDLIEFSRAVHAEMDAIISLARSGGVAARDGTLYCTTYPCHSCARHIVAAGIRDVVYIEPYLKSRAIALHDDAIIESTSAPTKDEKKVVFRLFTGVAPRRYAALFEKRHEIKSDGRLTLSPEADALHVDPIFTKSHIEFEQLIAKRVDETTRGVTHG